MKRLATTGVWVASVVATYVLVRTSVKEPAAPKPGATVRDARIVRAAPPPRLERAVFDVSEDDTAFREALATLERDLSDGRWSAADRDRLNVSTRSLTAPQAGELYDVLFPKLNAGAVQSDIDGPPL